MNAMAALLSGLLFGFGLILSGMINPAKVQNFLDVTGTWDPSLALVMAGAIAVAGIGFRLVSLRERPIADAAFHLPERSEIDVSLVLGAALFGVGWGLVGFCPGPAIASLTPGGLGVLWFVGAMVLGLAAVAAARAAAGAISRKRSTGSTA